MEENFSPEDENPIPEFVDAKTFKRMKKIGLLDPIGLRNYCIKKKYLRYRKEGLSMFSSLERLSLEYHLAYEYLRKMIGLHRVSLRQYRMSPL